MAEEFFRGQLLIANSSILTDYFHNSVILMIEHDQIGAFGLVLNKPLGSRVSGVLQGIPENDAMLFSGGPVDSSFISILHENGSLPDPGIEVIPGVYMGRTFELLLTVMRSDARYRVFQGYSGWGSSQLEEEILRKSWVAAASTAEMIFNNNIESVWRDALKSKGGIYRYFAEHTKDPMLN